ncbi:MAG: C1 family peptidase, partial [Dehalococcoidia bacterium]
MKKIAIFSGLTIILAMLLLGSMIPAALADEPAKGEFPDVIDLGAVQKEIEAKGLKWTAGETSKSGLSEEQKDRLRGLKVAPKSEKAGTVRLPTALRAIPYGTFDWRNKDGENWLTPVKDQGNCGSCWAFAALGSVESLINIERSNTTIDIDLSEQHLVSDCSSAGDCGGGYPDEALDYIRSNGVPEETCSPYRAANSPCDPCPNWVDRAWKIGSWSWVEASQAQRTEAYKWALREYGPMVVGLYAPDDMFYYTGGIYEPAFSPEFGENLNHAVVLVGYDDAGQYWIIKNSWGEGWGEDGYGKVSYGVLEQYDYALVADGTDGPDIPVIPQPTVIVTPAAAGAVAQYQIDFVAGEALTAGLDTITIAFPLGTTLPVSVSHHYIIVNGNILTVDPSVTGQSVTMITPADIPAFGQYTVVIAQASGIRNPSVAGDYTLDVSTSQEPEAQTSYPYSIGPQVTSGIQVQVLNQVGAPAQYANVFAYSDTSQCPIAGVGTGESGSAWLDIPNGAYTLVAFSGNDHFLVVKEDVNAPSSVTLDTEETVSVEFDCSDFQGNDLNASIFLSPYNCSFCMSLGEVSNGHLTADVTPMTYHQAHAWSWSDLYYLFRQDVTIGEGSIIEFHAAQMPTGQASINLAGFSS